MSPHSSKAMTRHAWFIFSILTICYALVSFFRTSTSTLAVDIMREFAVGGGLMSVMSSAYFYPYGFMQIPAGILSDRWGSRNTIASFLLIGAAGSLLFALSGSVTAATVGRVLIGVGMGITGTGVTKNVADMVLADDNFATIVGAVEEGRRIYDNIRKAIQFLLGSNMSEVISIFVATLLGFTILEPVHLLWINLVTDCFPALALGMENAEKDIMQRRPRSAKAGIFAGGMGGDIAYQGLMVSVLVLASYFIGHFMESGVWEIPANGLSPDGTTMAFLTMSMAEIFHSLNMRSQRGSLFTMGSRNWALLVSSFAALLLTTLVCEVPFIAAAFDFTSVEFNEYIIAIGMGFLVIPIVEIVKFFQRLAAKKKVGQN